MSEVTTETNGKTNTSLLIRGAIWIAIGALIAAALVCVVWVLIGDQDGLIGRAFLTILLLAGFAGIAILEAGLAPKRAEWLSLASMITWIVALLVGAVKIWLPTAYGEYSGGVGRFFQLLLVVGILQLALLHVRLFTPAAQRYVTTFTRVIYYTTIGLLVLLVGMLVFYLTLPDTIRYDDLYWRIVVALAILVAVGTTLIPLLNALFAPKKERPSSAAAPVAQAWPTYADGVTPLPVLQDGSPDWNAYYTGYPTAQQPLPVAAPQQAFPAAPTYPAPEAPAAPGAGQGYGQASPAPDVPPAPAVPDAPHAPAPPIPAVPDMPLAPSAPVDPPPPQAEPGAFPPPPPAPPR